MKQPYMNMHPVMEWNYRDRTEDITIYTYFLSFMEDYRCSYCDEENCHGECEDDEPKTPKIQLDQMDLQKIIDLLPAGIKPSDVKMKMSTDSGDYPTGHYITFYYTKFFSADPKRYKKDKAKYDAAYSEYEQKKIAYDEYVKQQEIKELEQRLSRLKK